MLLRMMVCFGVPRYDSWSDFVFLGVMVCFLRVTVCFRKCSNGMLLGVMIRFWE